jgi:hypothetical protein
MLLQGQNKGQRVEYNITDSIREAAEDLFDHAIIIIKEEYMQKRLVSGTYSISNSRRYHRWLRHLLLRRTIIVRLRRLFLAALISSLI